MINVVVERGGKRKTNSAKVKVGERKVGKDAQYTSLPKHVRSVSSQIIVSIDDAVLDKPYSQYMDLVSYFWSGKHHRSVKGINLITLYATDQNGQNIPPISNL